MKGTTVYLGVGSIVVVLALIVSACGPTATPTLISTPTSKSVPEGIPREAWKEKWDRMVVEARKEGAVSVYGHWSPETRNALAQALEPKYGINLQFSPFGRGVELAVKVQGERNAGLHVADVFVTGNSALALMKKEGILGPISPMLILPEVLDSNAWRGGKLPITDEKGMQLSMVGILTRTVVNNTDLIREGEIKSYHDLLKPEYKNKITLNDPTITGAGSSAISHLGYNLWGEENTVVFLRRLIKEQQPIIQRDNRLQIESVARGKFAICVGASANMIVQFLELGAPVNVADVVEDSRLTASVNALGIAAEPAHPNATIVFVNWLLSKEGQSLLARSSRSPSTRLDAATEGIDPRFMPAPGKKYYIDSEESDVAQAKWMEIARKVIEEATK